MSSTFSLPVISQCHAEGDRCVTVGTIGTSPRYQKLGVKVYEAKKNRHGKLTWRLVHVCRHTVRWAKRITAPLRLAAERESESIGAPYYAYITHGMIAG